jgi:hypothetical protein
VDRQSCPRINGRAESVIHALTVAPVRINGRAPNVPVSLPVFKNYLYESGAFVDNPAGYPRNRTTQKSFYRKKDRTRTLPKQPSQRSYT